MTSAETTADAASTGSGGRSQAPTLRMAPVVHAAALKQVEQPAKVVDPESLPVRPGEEPWTAEELAEVTSTLEEDVVRFADQLATSNAELVNLLRDGSEGAGRDPADVGSANYERDAEMSLANNAREMLDQSQLALRHIALGVYGSCDNCGQPIGKGRLQVFPRATLCVACKQREERR